MAEFEHLPAVCRTELFDCVEGDAKGLFGQIRRCDGVGLGRSRPREAGHGRVQQLPQSVGHNQAGQLPFGLVIAQPVQRSPSQLQRQVIGSFTLHQAGRAQHQFSVPFNSPGHVQVARLIAFSLDHDVVVAPAALDGPGSALDAGHVGAFDGPVRHAPRDAAPRNAVAPWLMDPPDQTLTLAGSPGRTIPATQCRIGIRPAPRR